MTERGSTVLEVLIASALMLTISAAVAAIALPLREAFDRSVGSSDLVSGGRMVLEQMAADVREAGSGASVGGHAIRLARVIPTLVPLADLDAGSPGAPSRALRIIRVPRLSAQGVLGAPAAAGTTLVELDVASQCTGTGPACGLRAGQLAVLHDASRAALVTIQLVADDRTVRLTSGLPSAFDPGAVLAAASITTYGLRGEPDGSFRLVKATSGTEQPMLQSVVDFAIATFGPDPLRIQEVQVRLRMETPSPARRGPAGRLFRRPGASTRPSSWIPDVELRVSIATRNAVGP